MGEGGKIRVIDVNCQVNRIEGFSGHSDYNQIIRFVQKLRPKLQQIFVNHGEKRKCETMVYTLSRMFKIPVYHPQRGRSDQDSVDFSPRQIFTPGGVITILSSPRRAISPPNAIVKSVSSSIVVFQVLDALLRKRSYLQYYDGAIFHVFLDVGNLICILQRKGLQQNLRVWDVQSLSRRAFQQSLTSSVYPAWNRE